MTDQPATSAAKRHPKRDPLSTVGGKVPNGGPLDGIKPPRGGTAAPSESFLAHLDDGADCTPEEAVEAVRAVRAETVALDDDFDYCDGSAVCLARLHLDFCRSLMGFNELAEQGGHRWVLKMPRRSMSATVGTVVRARTGHR